MGIYDNFIVITAQIPAALILVRSINAFRVATSSSEAKRTLSGQPLGHRLSFQVAATPSLPRGNSMISIRIPPRGWGVAATLENFREKTRRVGMSLSIFPFYIFSISYPLLPPAANSKNPLGFSGGRNGGCRWGEVPLEDIIFKYYIRCISAITKKPMEFVWLESRKLAVQWQVSVVLLCSRKGHSSKMKTGQKSCIWSLFGCFPFLLPRSTLAGRSRRARGLRRHLLNYKPSTLKLPSCGAPSPLH